MIIKRIFWAAVIATLLPAALTAEDPESVITPRELVDKVEAAYNSMQSYKSEGTITADYDISQMQISMEIPFSMRLRKPDLYLVTWKMKVSMTQNNVPMPGTVQHGAVWSDGTQPYLYMGTMNAYYKSDTDVAALSTAAGASGGATFTIPPLFLRAFRERSAPFSRLQDSQIERIEEVAGEECYVLSGPSVISKRETYWISTADYMIRKYERSLELPEGGILRPGSSDARIEETLKSMGQEVTDENKEMIRELISRSGSIFGAGQQKGSVIEYHATVSSPELERADFRFDLPEGAVLKDSPFGRRPRRDGAPEADIHAMVRAGNVQKVIEVLEKHPELADKKNDLDETPLHRAVIEQQTEMLRVLLEHGADPDLRGGSEGQTPLHRAVSFGQRQMVTLLLQHGADPNIRDDFGAMPLLSIYEFETPEEWEEIVKKLLEHGADANMSDTFGRTFLHMIASAPPELVSIAKNIGKSLIESGAEINKDDYYGNTPLHHAAAYGTIPMIEFFLDQGSDPSVWNRHGRTPLRRALSAGYLEEPIDRVVDAFLAGMEGHEIFTAARHGETDVLREMLSRDEGLTSSKDPAGWTALHWAVWGGLPETVRLLLDSGADPNAVGAGHMRPIELAACRGHTDVARILLEHPSHYPLDYEPGSDGWSALHFAAHWGQEEIAKLLVKHNADLYARDIWSNTPLYQAVRMGRVKTVKVLIEAGADIDVEGLGYQHPLHVAARGNDPKLVSVLIKAGAEVDAKSRYSGESPFFGALAYGRENANVVAVLLEHGADPNAVNKHGARAFTWVRSPEVVQLCIEAGADVNAGDQYGTTALHHAVRREDKDVIRVLLDAGADVEKKKADGKTPLDLALETGNDEIIKLLQEAINDKPSK